MRTESGRSEVSWCSYNTVKENKWIYTEWLCAILFPHPKRMNRMKLRFEIGMLNGRRRTTTTTRRGKYVIRPIMWIMAFGTLVGKCVIVFYSLQGNSIFAMFLRGLKKEICHQLFNLEGVPCIIWHQFEGLMAYIQDCLMFILSRNTHSFLFL